MTTNTADDYTRMMARAERRIRACELEYDSAKAAAKAAKEALAHAIDQLREIARETEASLFVRDEADAFAPNVNPLTGEVLDDDDDDEANEEDE